MRRARLMPLYAETRYWQDLGTVPLARPMPAAKTHAEIAYAQLAVLASALPTTDRQLLIAVPAWYTREQLAVLLGVKYKRESRGDFAHSNLLTVLNKTGEIVHRHMGLAAQLEETLAAIRQAARVQ